MKPIGHAWVAVQAVPQGNRKLLILGSILPEITFYTAAHPFSHEEIHEGGEKVYQYLLKKKPDWADLGLGMVTHSVSKGVDRFNFDEQLAILGYSGSLIEELRNRFSSILNLPYEAVKTRAHGILELAVELGIIREHPEFIEEIEEAVLDKEAREEIKTILSDCFKKPKAEVNRVVDELFNKLKPEYFRSAEGLAHLWRDFTSALSDPEPDLPRLAEVIKELSAGFNGKDKEFLEKSINWARSNIETLSSHPERKLT
jgi:hypothetical protein